MSKETLSQQSQKKPENPFEVTVEEWTRARRVVYALIGMTLATAAIETFSPRKNEEVERVRERVGAIRAVEVRSSPEVSAEELDEILKSFLGRYILLMTQIELMGSYQGNFLAGENMCSVRITRVTPEVWFYRIEGLDALSGFEYEGQLNIEELDDLIGSEEENVNPEPFGKNDEIEWL